MLYRALRNHRYFQGFGERLGLLPHPFHRTAPGAIWLHAVSVGEIVSAVELARRLRREKPGVPLFVSTTTLAGRATAGQKLKELADGVFFAPLDYRSIVRRVLRALKPTLVVVLETEIWPNLYRETRRSGAALLVVNGRISTRVFPRYRRFAWFFRHVLPWPSAIFVQSEHDRRRYAALGAPESLLEVAGNLKYDFAPSAASIPAVVTEFLDRLGPRSTWIAASTMPPRDSKDVDEDDLVLDAFRDLARQNPRLLLILVPRRPERFDEAERKLAAAKLNYVCRSRLRSGTTLELPGVLLLDSIGELAGLFSVADVVFMGGTLARRGGHNVLEPGFFAKPIIAGPHMENFPAIREEFAAERAMVEISGGSGLAPAVERLLRNRDEARAIGDRARRLALANRGATERVAGVIWRWHSTSSAQELPGALERLLLGPLAAAWGVGVRRSRSRALRELHRLDAPVISIGGITMGGTGKTPMVEWLARRLRDAGHTPSILTRGYRRRSVEPNIVLPAGSRAGAEVTGDEAQIFVRSGAAHVGVGADRWRTGRLLADHLSTDVFLLDDGFQHWRLHRDLDIVLIDSLDPLGGGHLFPIGRLREPPEALSRAGAFVLTRCEPGCPTAGIEHQLRQYNPTAPLFLSRVIPERWVDLESGAERPAHDPPFRKVAAFCGLANPNSFWRSLERLGLDIVFRWSFRDHHHYRHAELKQLALEAAEAGTEALVTTEKDVMNFPDAAASLFHPHPVYWLEIGVELEREQELLGLVESVLRKLR